MLELDGTTGGAHDTLEYDSHPPHGALSGVRKVGFSNDVMFDVTISVKDIQMFSIILFDILINLNESFRINVYFQGKFSTKGKR